MQDEANFSRLALDMARGRDFPLLSIDSSVGIRNPPMTVYVMAIPYLFTSDPVIATAWVGVLGTLAVLVCYGLARHYYGLIPAIVVGLLMATNPWMVMISRKIWHLLPLFWMLAVLTGLTGFIDGKRWAQLLHLPMLSVIGQLHYMSAAIIPITLFLIIIGRRRIKREFWLGFPLALLITLPFLIGAAREGYFSTASLQKLSRRGDKQIAVTLSVTAWRESLIMTSGAEAYFPLGQQRYPDDVPSVPENAVPLLIGFGIAISGSILWLLLRAPKRGKRAWVDIVTLLCLTTTPLLFTLTWTPLYTHYLIPVIPAAFMLIGAAAGDIWNVLQNQKTARLVLAGLGAIAVVIVTTIPAFNLTAHLQYVDVTATPGVFTTPLRYYMPARAYLLQMKPKAVLATVEGQFVGFNSEASIWDVLLDDIPMRRFADDNIEVYPAEPTPFLSHHCRNNTQNFYFRNEEGCLSVEMRSKSDFPAEAFKPVLHSVTLENGIKPVYYRWTLTPKLCLELGWEPTHPVSEDWQVKVHFTDITGKVIAYGDGAFWRGRYWQAGDLIVRRHCLNTPEQANQITGVRIGIYLQNGDQFQNLNVLDERGAAIGQEIEIRLTEAK